MRMPKRMAIVRKPGSTPGPYVFRAVHKQALGFWHLAPESGKTLAGEAFEAMKSMGAAPDDAFEIEIRRAPRKAGG
jgi:hypothetical protein